MERALFIAFLGILVWAPLPLASNRFWSRSLLEVLIGLLFLGWLATRALSGRDVPPQRILQRNKGIILLFWMIPAWTFFQLVPLPPFLWGASTDNVWLPISLDTGATFYQGMESIAYAMFFTLALALLHTPERLQRTLEVLVLTGVLQAAYGVMVTLGGKEFDLFGIIFRPQQAHSASGTFANRNHLAGYLEMCLALGVGLLLTHLLQSKDPYTGWKAILRRFLATLMSGKARLRVFLALMVVALVLTHSRMGNSAFFASLGIAALIGLVLYRKHKRNSSLIILFGSLILIDSFILGAWFGLDKLASRLEQTDITREERAYVFPDALEILKDHPVSGIGGGAFGTIFEQYKSDKVFYDYQHAHNDFLQIAIEYGLVGLLLFGLIVVIAFRAAIRAQLLRHTPILKGAAFAAMMAIISLMIHSAVDFNLQIPANALLFTLICAVACITNDMEQQHHHRHRSHSRDT